MNLSVPCFRPLTAETMTQNEVPHENSIINACESLTSRLSICAEQLYYFVFYLFNYLMFNYLIRQKHLNIKNELFHCLCHGQYIKFNIQKCVTDV